MLKARFFDRAFSFWNILNGRYIIPVLRDVDQMVDRLVWDQEATGSSPVIPTKEFFDIKNFNELWKHFILLWVCFLW